MSFLVCQALHKTYADGTEAVKGIDLVCVRGISSTLNYQY